MQRGVPRCSGGVCDFLVLCLVCVVAVVFSGLFCFFFRCVRCVLVVCCMLLCKNPQKVYILVK